MRLSSLLFFVFFSLLANAQEGVVIQSFQSPLSNKIEHAFISSDNQVILAGDMEGYVFFWRKEDGSISKIMRAHNQVITQMAVSGDSKYFVTTSTDNRFFLWDFSSGKKAGEVALENPCTALAFNESGSFLIYAKGNSVYKTPLTDLSNSVPIYKSESIISSGATVSNGKYFAIGFNDSLQIVNTVDGKRITTIKTCSGVSRITSSGNFLCALCSDGRIQLFELTGVTLQKKNETVIPFSTTAKPLLLPEQRNALFITETGEMQIWDWATNQLFQAEGLQESITALNSAGELMLTGNNEGEVALCKAPLEHGELKAAIGQTTVSKTTVKSLDDRQVRFQEPVEVQTRQLDIYVWDDENVDGDTISLSLNEEWILENYMVTKEKKKLTLNLVSEKKNTLVLYAENLGKAPPNTAVISFHDGSKERSLTLNSDLKRCDAVRFILKK